jgi:hypothetical protein
VTILFMDVVGSTRIRQRLDPEDTRTLIRSTSPMRCPGTISSSQYAHFQWAMPSAVNVHCSATMVAISSARMAAPTTQVRIIRMRSAADASSPADCPSERPAVDLDKRSIIYRYPATSPQAAWPSRPRSRSGTGA